MKQIAAEGVDGADARELELLNGQIELRPLFRLGFGTGAFDLAAQMKLVFAGCLFRKGDGNDAIERRGTGADQPDDTPHQRRGLPGAGGRLDEKGRPEFRRNAAARFGIGYYLFS